MLFLSLVILFSFALLAAITRREEKRGQVPVIAMLLGFIAPIALAVALGALFGANPPLDLSGAVLLAGLSVGALIVGLTGRWPTPLLAASVLSAPIIVVSSI